MIETRCLKNVIFIQTILSFVLSRKAKYSITFSRSERKLCLGLHYNGNNSFLFVNATKISQIKAKTSEIKPYSLCLGNILKDFTANNLKKKAVLNGCMYAFSVDFNIVDNSNMINIHKYLVEKNNVRCLALLKKHLLDY